MNIEKLLLPYCHPPLAGGTCLGSGEGFEHPGSYLWSFLAQAIRMKSCVSSMKSSPLCREKLGLRPVGLTGSFHDIQVSVQMSHP